VPLPAERGIRWHATVGEFAQWPDAWAATAEALGLLTDFYTSAAGRELTALMHSLGGCDEVDAPAVTGAADTQWAAQARMMQPGLWRQATADPRTAGLPVVGSPTRTDVTPERAQLLGDLVRNLRLGQRAPVQPWG